jgi:hypothetical protein
MIEDASLGAGYQLKLIDMDFSVLADRRAPWHGHQGYVGTDNYRSPEHMTRGGVPLPASDVFTCGLILYELLVGMHPYWQEDQAEYAKLARAHDLDPPALLGTLPAPASNAVVSAMLHRCLSPDPGARPTAMEMRAALSGRGATAATGARAGAETARKPHAGEKRSPPARSPLASERIHLVAPDGESLRIGIRTEIGKAVLRRFGPDAEFWDAKQCTVERRPDGRWIVTPALGTVNETLLNGVPLTAPRALSVGDVIAAGRSAKGLSKLPLTAHAA